MKKLTLLALAVPALFAACSQDEIVENVQTQQSTELLGKVAGDVNFVLSNPSSTRLSWNQQNVKEWDKDGDAFSLFWVGATGNAKDDKGNYQGVTNALYESKDGGVFESKNIIYEGNHVIVYPVDKKHTTQKAVAVEVGSAIQDNTEAVGERSVFVSDLLTIKAAPAKDSDRKKDEIYAGYNEPVNASVRPLSSYLALNLEFKMGDKMTADEIIVEGVELEVVGGNAFTFGGNLTNDSTSIKLGTITSSGKKVSLKVPENTKLTDGKYVANFTLLPTVADTIDKVTASKIVVKTNFGDVTIDEAINVINPNAAADGNKYQSDTTYAKTADVEKAVKDGKSDDAVVLDFKPIFTSISTRATAASSYGKTVVRNVTVDMSKADINGRDLATSDDLIKAYDVYTKLGKTDAVSFDLVPANKIFEMTPEAVAKINNVAYKLITLTQGNTTGIKLVAGKDANGATLHTAVPAFTNDIQIKESAYDLILAEDGGNWALDVNDAALVNAYKSFSNEGALTISQGTTVKKALAKDLANTGNITFSGKVEMPTTLTGNGSVTIPAKAEAILAAAGNKISGKMEIKAEGVLKIHNTTTFDSTAVVDVTGMLLTQNGKNSTNFGTINVLAETTVQLTNNGDSTKNGIIVVATRACSENIIIGGSYDGYIKWTCDDATTNYSERTYEKINYLILNKTMEFGTLKRTLYLEVAEGKTIQLKGTISVKTLTIGEGSYVTIPASAKVNLTTNLDNNGTVVVNGAFTYPATVTKEGYVYWQN